MRRLGGILAVVALLVAAAVLPTSSSLAGGPGLPRGPGGEKAPVNNDVPDNIVPPDLVINDTHAAEQAASLKIKEARMAALSSAPSALLSSPVVLSVPGVDQRPCLNYCGPASTQEIFYYKGERSHTLADIAVLEKTDDGTGHCWLKDHPEEGGTCVLPIRDALNQHTPGLPWANFYIATHLNHDSLYAAASALQSFEHTDMGGSSYRMPLIVLLNPNPPDGTPYYLPGYEGSKITGHYITVNGYEGIYDGSDGSARTYYRDSWYNPPDQHYTRLNCFADCIYFKDGYGSCTAERPNIIW